MSLFSRLRSWFTRDNPSDAGPQATTDRSLPAADGPYCEVAPWPHISPHQVLGVDEALARNAAAAWNSGRMVVGSIDENGQLHMHAVGTPEPPDEAK